MIRIRPGRSWRLNPAYIGELRATRPGAFTGEDVLDVLGIEVDGIDIAAGLGEAEVLVAVDELSQALLRLSEGAVAAQATVGRGPTELVLEARGPDVALSLVSLAPPSRVLASGLIVEGARLRAAAVAAVAAIRHDLLAVSASLRASPLLQRLDSASEQLLEPPRRRAKAWPPSRARAVNLSAGRGALHLSVELPDAAAARLAGMRAVAAAPLAAHLGTARIRLQAEGVPGLEAEGPALLLLRNLLRDAAALADAWEAADRAFSLQLGRHELALDLQREELRARGWRKAVACGPLDLAQAVADVAAQYARLGADELLADLRDRAARLTRHARDLESGDLRRAPEAAVPPPPRETHPPAAPLARGRMRRLIYRAAWSARAPGALRLLPFAHRLVAELPDTLVGFDVQRGNETFRVAAAPGAVSRGESLFFAEHGDGLVRLDVPSGELRFRRRLRGAGHPATLFALPGGVLRSLPGEGFAVVDDAGALLFRTRLAGGAPVAVSLVDGVILIAFAAGLAGIDAKDGSILWKRKLRAEKLVGPIAVNQDGLVRLDPHTGKPAFRRELPVRDAWLQDEAVAVLSADRVAAFAAGDGAQLFSVSLPWATSLRASGEAEPSLLAAGPASLACLREGKVAWIQEGLPATGPAQAHRNIVLCGTGLHDLDSGAQLAELPAPATLLPDLSCALLSEGEVRVLRLASHFSVVQ